MANISFLNHQDILVGIPRPLTIADNADRVVLLKQAEYERGGRNADTVTALIRIDRRRVVIGIPEPRAVKGALCRQEQFIRHVLLAAALVYWGIAAVQRNDRYAAWR